MGEDALQAWVGRTQTMEDMAAPGPLTRLAALLDHRDPPWTPSEAPPLPAHWRYFLPDARQSEIAADGHPQRGGLLPPVDLPRRMWAGSRLNFHFSIPIGAVMTRLSRVQP